MASSSNPSPLNFTHNVFLSYLHADTGNSFTSHLKSALGRERFNVAMNDTVDKGEEISDTVLRNISESLVWVVVFSKSYATCAQCLDELVKIWQTKEENGGGVVLPVFLEVEPTHVRNQTGAFGDGFQRLIESSKQFKEKEETWKSALTKTANLSGWDSMVKSESIIVDEVVNRIENVLLHEIPWNDLDNGFVGVSRIEDVVSLLGVGTSERVRLIGLWGMGGIGKTTIAERVFYRVVDHFEGVCFVGSVRERLERNGIDCLRRHIVSQLLGVECILSPPIQRNLKQKRILLVLDDVNDQLDLKTLIKGCGYCGKGSRFMLTGRNKQVLKNNECKEIYKVEELNKVEAFQLFKLHAFKQSEPTTLYLELSKQLICYAQGLPLALEVLGRNLYDKSIKEWESELAKLKQMPDMHIGNILRISFDGLTDKEKGIFLDVACIFKGWAKDRVENILDACGFYAGIGISRLIDRALLTVSSSGILRMHDLLQQLGQDIVLHECEDPGKRSRLWEWKDIYEVLAENKGSEKVEVISVDFNERGKEMCMKADFFDKMTNMRVISLIDFHGIIQLQALNSLPSKRITYLRWDHFPLTSFPGVFTRADHLVELHLFRSRLKQLWSEVAEPHLPMLEHMNLRWSKDLVKLPNLSKCVNLKTLDVSYCGALVEVPSSLQHLSKLQRLYMVDCRNLAKLPMLPQSMVVLWLIGTNFKELPSWIGSLFRLEILMLLRCSNLTSRPESLGSLQSVKYPHMFESGKRNVPSSIGELDKGCGMVSLHTMNLGFSRIESLPTNMMHLPCLKSLYLRKCNYLRYLPDLPSSLEELDAGGCTWLTTVGNFLGECAEGPFYLNMAGCFSLDQKSRMRCLAIAQARLNAHAERRALFSDPYLERRAAFLPGNEVPDWVKYKATGSSIEVELLGGMLIEHLRQPTICVVIDDFSNIMGISYYGSLDLDVEVRYKCMFLTEFGERCFDSRYEPFYIEGRSTHVLIFGGPGEVTHSSGEKIEGLSSPQMMCSNAKFEFEVARCKILQCGVSFPSGKANMRKRKAEANLTKESNLTSRLASAGMSSRRRRGRRRTHGWLERGRSPP